MNCLKRTAGVLMSILVLACTITTVHAQEQPVKIVVGFAPGGTTDVLARQIATLMSAKIGRTVIVENKAGASGNIAAASVAQSAADGSTLLFVASSHATNATLYKKLNFDTVNDFASIGLVATTPYVLVVHPQVPAKNVGEFVSPLVATERR